MRFYSVWIRIWMRKPWVCMCVSMNTHYTHVAQGVHTLVNIHSEHTFGMWSLEWMTEITNLLSLSVLPQCPVGPGLIIFHHFDPFGSLKSMLSPNTCNQLRLYVLKSTPHKKAHLSMVAGKSGAWAWGPGLVGWRWVLSLPHCGPCVCNKTYKWGHSNSTFSQFRLISM